MRKWLVNCLKIWGYVRQDKIKSMEGFSLQIQLAPFFHLPDLRSQGSFFLLGLFYDGLELRIIPEACKKGINQDKVDVSNAGNIFGVKLC
jgi:hypothetical protein